MMSHQTVQSVTTVVLKPRTPRTPRTHTNLKSPPLREGPNKNAYKGCAIFDKHINVTPEEVFAF